MTLTRAAVGAIALATQAEALGQPIKPDWDLLTDFNAQVQIRGKDMIRAYDDEMANNPWVNPRERRAARAIDQIIAGGGANVKVNFNLEKGFLDIDKTSHVETRDNLPIGGPARMILGTKVKGNERLVIDRRLGYMALRAHVKVTKGALAGANAALCVKAQIPPGILDGILGPNSMLAAQIKHKLATADARIAWGSEHHSKDVSVDGKAMALFGNRLSPRTDRVLYEGYRLNLVPVGMGFEPPANDEWNPEVHVASFERGAVSEELYCGESDTVLSASEFWAHPEHEDILNRMNAMAAFAVPHYPMRPSEAFQELAEEEEDAMEDEEEAEAAPTNDAVYLGATGFAGLAAGALVTYGVLRTRRTQHYV